VRWCCSVNPSLHQLLPIDDAIQEFKVVTSPYSAEYGRAPGAAISVTTKSGSNQLHGTAYEYQPLPGTLDANGPLPYPNFGNVQWREMAGDSRYYGVDTQLQKRFGAATASASPIPTATRATRRRNISPPRPGGRRTGAILIRGKDRATST
jgi:hypothetical protein